MHTSDTGFEDSVGVQSNDQAEGMTTEDGEGIVVSLSGVSEQGNLKLLNRGLYNCSVASIDFSMSQRSGNPMWTVVFEVEEGQEGAGSKLFYYLVFNEGGMSRVKRFLSRVESDNDYARSLLTTDFKPRDVADEGRLLGARAKVRVDFRTYEGTKRNEVKDVLPPAPAGNSGAGSGFAGV